MAADGNTAPTTAKITTETSVSGEQPTIMPVIVQEITGAISRDGISTINKPDTGTIRVIDTGNLPEINFSFAASDVKVTALDVDLVMIFNDNSKIILPSLAMDLVGGNPPRLTFKGVVAYPQSIVAQIGETNLIEITPSVQLTSPDFLPKKKAGNTNDTAHITTGQNGIGGGEPPVPPRPIVSGAKAGRSTEGDGAKTAEFNAPPIEKVQPGSIATSNSSAALNNPAVISPPKIPANTATSYAYETPIIAKLYQIVGQTTGTSDDGSAALLKGGSGTSPADVDSSFTAQSRVETLTGTAGNDEIWADDPSFSSGGRAGRIISLTPAIVAGYTMNMLSISGVPDGYQIIGLDPTGKDEAGNKIYTIGPKELGSNEFQFKLAYKVPEAASDQPFKLDLTFNGIKNGTTAIATASSSVYIQVSDVQSDAQQITTNDLDGRSIINLSLLPTGNSISAGDGDDTIHAAAGADAIDGGTGDNWVAYNLSGMGVTVDLKNGGHHGFAEGDTYTNVHNIIGSTYSDTLIGDDAGDSINGNGGGDSLQGGLGNDYFSSGVSSNTINGGGGSDNTVDYTRASASIFVNLSDNTSLNQGHATVDTLFNIQSIIGSKFNDTMISGHEANVFDGGKGNDDLSYAASDAAVSVNLATGDAHGGYAEGDSIINFENLVGSNFNDTLIGSTGNNRLDGGQGDDQLNGGGGNDTLLGNVGNDTIVAGSGTQSINGGSGNDTMDGGQGSNTYAIYQASGFSILDSGRDGTVIANFSGTFNSINLSDTTKFSGIKNVSMIEAGSGSFTAIGSQDDNVITGGVNNDSIDGSSGNDTMIGGFGNDIYVVDNPNDIVVERNGEGTDTIQTTYNTYTLASIAATLNGVSNAGYVENLTFTGSGSFSGAGNELNNTITGGSGNDSLFGADGNDSILGNAGLDTLSGGLGNDIISGGGGNDTVVGGSGNDTLDGGGQSGDTLDYSYVTIGGTTNGTSGITLTLNGATTATVTGLVAGDQDAISNFENVIGTNFNDCITGDTLANSLSGGLGNDTLSGNTGNDTLDGGAGFNVLDYSYYPGPNGLIVNIANIATSSGMGITVTSGADVDTVMNFEGIIGGSGNDSFTGDYNANYLGGGAGADTLLGSLGSDTLSGGLGNDSLDGNGTSVDPYAVDVVDYTYATAGVTLSVSSINSSTAYTFSVGGSATDVDTLKNFEGIIGGSGNDSLTGDSNANYLSGGSGGADTLSGGGGNDILKLDWSSLNLSNLDGGAGNDTVVLTGTGSVSLNFTQASFTGVLTNAEYLDFSAATSSNNVSLSIDGAGIQKILTGATSNTNAGTLDLKLDAGHFDTLTLATNASYTYSNTSSAADASRLSGAVNLSTLNAAGSDIYVFDSTHTTLLAQLHYHT